MKALSIRQPWAWLILHAGKDIENRSWHTHQRGRILVHAAKGLTRDEYDDLLWQLDQSPLCAVVKRIPAFGALERGGVVGLVEIVDCVERHHSPWFGGPYGFVLRNPEAIPFHPCRGALGFFEVPHA